MSIRKKVFLSYKREDRPRVKDLAENLRHAGFEVWYDESIQLGDHWWEAILDKIEACDVFVFALSQPALRSIPCQREREYAVALGKPILLIQVGTVNAVPVEYATVQYEDFSKGNPRTLLRLIGGINNEPENQPTNPNAVRPLAPIAPVEEIAATLDTQADLDFNDQAAIFYNLKKLTTDPQVRGRALELVNVL